MLISMNTVLYHKEKERSGAVTHGFSLSLSLSHTHPPTSMTHKFRNAQSSVVRGFSHKLIHTLSHTLLLPWYTHTLSLFYFHGVHMHTHSHTVLHFHGAHTHTLFYFHGVHTHAHTHTCTPMVLLPTWFTSSGMPRALSISSRPVASVLLKSVCNWSNSALSSLWPSRLEGGPRRSSREFLRIGLKRDMESTSMVLFLLGKKKAK